MDWSGKGWDCAPVPGVWGTQGALSILPTPLHTITSAQSMGNAPSPGDNPPPAQLHPRGLIHPPPGTAANTIEQILVLLPHRDEQTPGCSQKTWDSLCWAQEQLGSLLDTGTTSSMGGVGTGAVRRDQGGTRRGPGGDCDSSVPLSRILHHQSIPPVAL